MGNLGGVSSGSGLKKISQPFKPFDVKKKIGGSRAQLPISQPPPVNNVEESTNQIEESVGQSENRSF